MAAQVARHFPATHAEADEGRIVQVQFVHHRREIVRQRIVLIAIIRLFTATEATAIIADRTHARLGDGERQVIEGVR